MSDSIARDHARAEVSQKLEEFLKAEYPSLVKIVGGYGLYTSYVDEDTQKQVPVTISITTPLLKATARSKAFSLEEAAEEYRSRPGRRVADPKVKEERAKRKQETADRNNAYMGILREWIKNNEVVKMTAKDIWEAVPELQTMPLMHLGSFLKKLYEDPNQPLLNVALDTVTRKKVYSKIKH